MGADAHGTGHPIVLTERRQFSAACAEVSAAKAVLADTLGKEHWRTADANSVLGSCMAGLGEFAAAEPLLINSLPVIRKARGERAIYSRQALQRLVDFYVAWERPGEAQRYRLLLSAALE